MKRNISDLLDAYPPQDLVLTGSAPLSPSRIKELTMSKVMLEKPKRKKPLLRLLAVAAIILALSVSALATGRALGAGEFFWQFFVKQGGDVLPGQVAVMDQVGTTFEGGVTSNGTTITPIAALADENVYYLRLRIEAPDGTILPEYNNDTQGYYQLSGVEAGQMMTLEPAGNTRGSYGYQHTLIWPEDEDQTDRVKEVVMLFKAQAGGGLCFNDGVSKLLTIHGLWLQTPDKQYKQILSGEFVFDIGLRYQSKVIPLNAGGLTWFSEEGGYTSTLRELTISPLSLSFCYTATKPKNGQIAPDVGPLEVVLKDGSTVPMSSAPSGKNCGYLVFQVPLDLEQVDYVRFGAHKIPLQTEQTA